MAGHGFLLCRLHNMGYQMPKSRSAGLLSEPTKAGERIKSDQLPAAAAEARRAAARPGRPSAFINVSSEADDLYEYDLLCFVHRVDDPHVSNPQAITSLQLTG